MKIFYSTVENFPPKRVDIVQLFMIELRRLGLNTEWNMRRNAEGKCETTVHLDQRIGLPLFITPRNFPATLLNKAAYWACDIIGITKNVWRRPDVIQVRDKYLAALYGLVVAAVCRLKFTYWCSYPFPEHDMEMARITHGLRRLTYFFRGKLGYWLMYGIVLPRASHVFAQSSQMKIDLVANGIAPHKISVVPMGICDTDIPPVGDTPATESHAPLILYLGTLIRLRRLDMLVRAFASVIREAPEVRLVFVGDGDSAEDRALLESEVQRLGLTDSVHFTGQVSRGEALTWVQRATICLSPFYPTFVLRSTSPTKLIEYMAMGKAVVANDHPEQAEVLRQSGAGICVPWDEQAFSKAILELVTDSRRIAEMGARGREWVLKNRTYSRIAEDVYAVYQRILSGR